MDPQGTDLPETATLSDQSPLVLFKERYRLSTALGSGGFGTVYLADDTQLHNRQVVVKILHRHGEAQGWIHKKFREECEALARLNHPSIVGVTDQGETADGKSFLVLEYVEGLTLRRLIAGERIDLTRAARLLRQIGQALDVAHRHGVYHRDLKPENIIVRSLGSGEELPVIIDFGIATVLGSEACDKTVTRVAGSLHYMAPEQLRGRPEAASDIYALGVIAFEIVCGQLPFQTGSPVELYVQQQQGPGRKPCDVRPELPAPVQDLILRALNADPKARPLTAADFGMDLERALQPQPAPQPALPPTTRGKAWMLIPGLAIAAALAVTWWHGAKSAPPLRVAPPVPAHSLAYWILGLPDGGSERRLVHEMLFPTGYRIAVMVHATESGRLYVVNQGPATDGKITWNTLFPSPSSHGGSSALPGGSEVRIPEARYFRFDSAQGTENLWLIWSSRELPELESLQKWITETRGEVRSEEQVHYLEQLTRSAPAEARRDEQNSVTVVSRRGDPLVYDLKLEHN